MGALERGAVLGSVAVGPSLPVRIMAAINVSPESFYRGSVSTTPRAIAAAAEKAVEDGAELLDLGAMSTAPYLKAEITEEAEMERVRVALEAVAGTRATVSVDTVRASVADAALRHGATVLNDVTGLKHDERMASVVRERGASLLAMAHSAADSGEGPARRVAKALRETMRIAERAGLDERRLVLDPGIGFFREEGAGLAYSPQRRMPWYRWDCEVLANLKALQRLGRPICVGVSRKSFIGKLAGLESPDERLPGSLAATALAVSNGASMVRTHDVRETVQAVRVAEAISRRIGRPGRQPS